MQDGEREQWIRERERETLEAARRVTRLVSLKTSLMVLAAREGVSYKDFRAAFLGEVRRAPANAFSEREIEAMVSRALDAVRLAASPAANGSASKA